MRAIRITAERLVEEVHYDPVAASPTEPDSLQALVDGWIELHPAPEFELTHIPGEPHVMLVVPEEPTKARNGNILNVGASRLSNGPWLFGDAVLVAYDDEGYSVDLPEEITVEEVRRLCAF